MNNNEIIKEPFLILDNLGSLHSMNSKSNNKKISLRKIHKLFFKKFKKIKHIELDNNIIMVYGNNAINEPWEFNSIASFISNVDIFSSIVIFISKYNIKSYNKKISLKNNNYSFNDLYNDVINILNKANNLYLESLKSKEIDKPENNIESGNSEQMFSNAILNINNDSILTINNNFINEYIMPNKFLTYEKINNNNILLTREGFMGIIYEDEYNNSILDLYFTQNHKNNNIIS